MNTTEEKAIHSFRSGLNCAQSVVTAYADRLKYDTIQAAGLSCGFGGGMGRLQQTCGAVTGAFMVLGMYYSQRIPDQAERKNITYAAVRKLHSDFKLKCGTADCRTLLGCDLQTEEGMRFHKETNQNKTICEKCISAAVELLDEMMNDELRM